MFEVRYRIKPALEGRDYFYTVESRRWWQWWWTPSDLYFTNKDTANQEIEILKGLEKDSYQ